MCDCANKIDEQLKPMDGRIERNFQIDFGSGRVGMILGIKVNKCETGRGTKKPPAFIAVSFCPFCGKPWEKYSEEKETKAS